jgi:L-alanine-DL-glutamate epimerase-like enolase superfamily enzyme
MELHLPLVAAIPNGLFIEYIPSLDPILTEPLKLVGGCFHVGDAPGLGLNIDWQKLKKYEVAL